MRDQILTESRFLEAACDLINSGRVDRNLNPEDLVDATDEQFEDYMFAIYLHYFPNTAAYRKIAWLHAESLRRVDIQIENNEVVRDAKLLYTLMDSIEWDFRFIPNAEREWLSSELWRINEIFANRFGFGSQMLIGTWFFLTAHSPTELGKFKSLVKPKLCYTDLHATISWCLDHGMQERDAWRVFLFEDGYIELVPEVEGCNDLLWFGYPMRQPSYCWLVPRTPWWNGLPDTLRRDWAADFIDGMM